MDDFTIRAAVVRSELVEGMPGNPWEPFTFLDGNPQHNRKSIDRGLMPWWTDAECRISFLRPLTAVTHMLDYRLWPNAPVLMHVQSLIWFALLVWAVAVLYRRLMGPTMPAWIAALAALLFVVEDAHAFSIAWLANRNVILAGLFGVLTLIAFDRWRRDGWRPGAWLAPLALLAGLLAKEAAMCTGAYLLGYALFLDRGRRVQRVVSLLPCLVVGVVWFALHRGLGFGTAATNLYADPRHDPMGFAHQVVQNAPILLLGQWGLSVSEMTGMLSPSAWNVYWWGAVIFLALVGALLVPLVARNALARFWTLGMLLSVLPACIPFPMDRLLMFVGLGAMGLMAQLLGGLQEGGSWLPRRVVWRGPAWGLAGLLIAVHLVVAPLMLLVQINVFRNAVNRVSHRTQGFPSDPQLKNQTAIVVNAPWCASRTELQERCWDGRTAPAHILDLAPSTALVKLSRRDRTTLAVRPLGGYLPPRGWSPRYPPPIFSTRYRGQLLHRWGRHDDRPFQLGETIELTAATIEITDLTDDGRAAEATFRFLVPLEDPSLRWLKVTRQGYVEITPPKIGETLKVSSYYDYD